MFLSSSEILSQLFRPAERLALILKATKMTRTRITTLRYKYRILSFSLSLSPSLSLYVGRLNFHAVIGTLSYLLRFIYLGLLRIQSYFYQGCFAKIVSNMQGLPQCFPDARRVATL